MQRTKSLFDFLGFTVQSVHNGVYRLNRTAADENVYIALLYSSEIVKPPQASLQLYMLEVPLRAAEAAQHQWAELDARRLGESGLLPVELSWGPLTGEGGKQVSYPRYDGRVRRGVELFSGDIVCYN